MFAIVCGSRYWVDSVTIQEALVWLPPDTTVIHGNQLGADLCADNEARKLGFRVVPFTADWKIHGRAAGPIRNQKMLQELIRARQLREETLVLAFHEDPGLGLGTRDMVKRSLKAKVEVIIFLKILL